MQIDEVRYAENLKPLGLDFIKLGLQDVLYNPKTKEIYTPNTNQSGVMGETALQKQEDGATIEARYNKNHGAGGRFSSGGGKGSKQKSTNAASPKLSREAISKGIVGRRTSDGRVIKSVAPHAADRMIGKDIRVSSVLDAVKKGKPTKGNKPNSLVYFHNRTKVVFGTRNNQITTAIYRGEKKK